MVADLGNEGWGTMSLSVYETARLLGLALGRVGHAERIEFLLAAQRADGGWGGPDGYGLVPTLSATEALVTVAAAGDDRVADAADRGLRRLAAWLGNGAGPPLPDTPAIELIVPALVDALRKHLRQPPAGLAHWRGRNGWALPAAVDAERFGAIRSVLAAGAPVPEKLLHSLETMGEQVAGAASVRPVGPGT